MKVRTGLGDIDISEDVRKQLQMRLDATNVTDEVERIIRCAIQAGMDDTTVSRRIAIARLAAEGIRVTTGGDHWL